MYECIHSSMIRIFLIWLHTNLKWILIKTEKEKFILFFFIRNELAKFRRKLKKNKCFFLFMRNSSCRHIEYCWLIIHPLEILFYFLFSFLFLNHANNKQKQENAFRIYHIDFFCVCVVEHHTKMNQKKIQNDCIDSKNIQPLIRSRSNHIRTFYLNLFVSQNELDAI